MSFMSKHYKFFSILGDLILVLAILMLGYIALRPSVFNIGLFAIVIGIFLIIQSISMGTLAKILFKVLSFLFVDKFDREDWKRNSKHLTNSQLKQNYIFSGIVMIVFGLLILFVI